MSGQEVADFKNSMPEWQSAMTFNVAWQYGFVNRSAFYANITGQYKEYMLRWVQNYLWWADGYVPYFHNADQGIFSTKIASALINGVSRRIIGGKIFFKNKNKETPQKGVDGAYIVNKALAFLTEWADDTAFAREVKKAVNFACAGGTSLMKLDKRGGKLYARALRFDSFYPTVIGGKLVDVYCYLKDFTRMIDSNDQRFENYYVVEHRYFDDYTEKDGSITRRKPLVCYEIRKSTGSMTNGQDYGLTGQKVQLRDVERKMRSEIAKAYDGIIFDKPIPLPFVDSLGAELINFTECVNAIPELPFGDSLLANIMPYLMSYDFYWSAFNTDMYLGRGKVMLPKHLQSKEASSQNSGFSSMLFTYYSKSGASGDGDKPLPVQFDLRSNSWTEIRTMIIQNIAINTGMNLSSIASFLNDTKGTKTAREISTEENETALYVEDKRDLIGRPINRLLKLVTLHSGFADDVVIRWSEAGLTNIYTRTEMLATALQGGFISKQKAAQMFNQDDDEYQQAEEWDRILADEEKNNSFGGNMDFNESNYFGENNDEVEKKEE